MPSGCSPVFEWKFFQGNLGRSQVGTQELPHLDLPFKPDVYLVQEPYLVNNSIYGLPLNWRTVVAKSGKVLLTVRNPSIALWIRHVTNHVVAVDLTMGGDSVTIVIFYFPPSLSQASLVQELEAVRLAVWNDPLSGPTFETDRAQGWIDVTLSSPLLHRRKGHWEVHNTLLSDHHPLLFVLAGSVSAPSTLYSPLNRRQLGQNRVGSFSGPSVQPSLRVPWWDSALDTQRKKTRALRARFQRCKHPAERLLRRTIYKREVARYKFLIKTKSRACFESFCAQLTRLNPFQLPYKLAAQKIRSKPVLQGVRDTQGCMTSLVEATVRVIVSKLFPSDNDAHDTPDQRAVRQMVLDFSGTVTAPPFLYKSFGELFTP
ncbi:hypothetical protein AVEN_18303-1 [Araneus ventricosus]|uniref:Uncharacterized protein n=1 Tax=Araneus ventricosus TaxID=182803 RepID=A0A4Y2S951_ARAVE|nr:hypothetical protein AVEN_18303-1 [Araneus ventricosus]